MRNLLLAVLTLGFMLGCSATAIAQDGQVVIPYGAWIQAIADTAVPTITAVLLALLARLMAVLPAPIVAILQTFRVEQLLDRAIHFGVNAVAGATHGRTLTVPVASQVLETAMDYAVTQAPTLVRWLGGELALREKLFARLEIEADGSADILLKR